MSKRVSGMVGIWSDDEKILVAAQKMRDAGYKHFDAITPFPVHGMEEAVGVKRSMIPWVTFIMGSIGCGLGLLLQYWVAAVSWPINVGGKPMFSAPAFIPITFELTILFAALSSVVAMFVFNKMPSIGAPVIDPDLTSHKFALWVPETESGYSVEKVEAFLKDIDCLVIMIPPGLRKNTGADHVAKMTHFLAEIEKAAVQKIIVVSNHRRTLVIIAIIILSFSLNILALTFLNHSY